MKRINVTETFLPPIEEYEAYLENIWQTHHLTNQGPLLKEFERQVKDYLNIKNFQFVANGTVALQISLEALDIREGEVITTPFSYVATTSAILWQRCKPVYVDIDPNTYCIDPNKIEAAITSRTKAIMPVHVFGNPCDVEAIDIIAKKHNLKVIYDAAHAFGVKLNGKSLLDYGDISVCSFHATKPFHTIEGGAIISRHESIDKKLDLIKRFGHYGDEHTMLGINGKATEFQAAMGLANLKYIGHIIEDRKELSSLYDELLGSSADRPGVKERGEYNFAYYPVVLRDEKRLTEVERSLKQLNIYPRRYFFPSLNTLPYLGHRQSCPVSEDIAARILCLPLYTGLERKIVETICGVINDN